MKQLLKSTRLLIICVVLFLSCKQTPSGTSGEEEMRSNCKIFAAVDGLRLRASAGAEGAEITKISLGEELKDLNECSTFTTKVKLNGHWYEEPWIFVETQGGQKGWVYAAAVSFKGDTPAASTRGLIEKRAIALFGQTHFKEILSYQSAYLNAKNETSLRAVMLQGDQLRSKLEQVLLTKVAISEETREMSPLDWLDVLLPGYQASLVAEGTAYRLFKTFKVWSEKSKNTTGAADNKYFEYSMAYYADSIEYFFGKNYMLLTDVEGASLLGEGKHLELLQKADALLQQSEVFKMEILQYKTELMDDIIGVKGATYWQPKEKILQEITNIEKSGLRLLDQADLIALSTRKKQFENAAANGILVNQRAGE